MRFKIIIGWEIPADAYGPFHVMNRIDSMSPRELERKYIYPFQGGREEGKKKYPGNLHFQWVYTPTGGRRLFMYAYEFLDKESVFNMTFGDECDLAEQILGMMGVRYFHQTAYVIAMNDV